MSTEYRFLVTDVATRMQDENDRLEATHFEASIKWEKEKKNLTLECERLKKQMLELKYQTEACLLEQRNLEGALSEQKHEEVEQIELRLKSERRLQLMQVELRKHEDQKQQMLKQLSKFEMQALDAKVDNEILTSRINEMGVTIYNLEKDL